MDTAAISERFFAQSPYAGFDPTPWPLDLQGWNSEHPLLGAAVRRIRPRLMVEVGTWKGASAIHLAEQAKRAGIATTLICVDTWLGSAGVYIRRDDTFDALRPRNGYPRLYYQFLANVLHSGHDDVIVPLPQTSDNAAQILRAFGLKPQLVHLDASHDYLSVRNDLLNYFDLLTGDGVLVGDDYAPAIWPGVVQAVDEFARERGLQPLIDGEKFVLARGEGAVLGIGA